MPNNPSKQDDGNTRVCRTCKGNGYVEVPNGTKDCDACQGKGYINIGTV